MYPVSILQSSTQILVLGPQQAQRIFNTGSAFQMSLPPDWQINYRFFNRLIMVPACTQILVQMGFRAKMIITFVRLTVYLSPSILSDFETERFFLLLTVTNSKQLNWIIKSLNAMEHWVCTWYQRSLTQKLSHFTSTLRTEQRCIKPKKNPAVRYTIHKNLNIHTRINSICKVSY